MSDSKVRELLGRSVCGCGECRPVVTERVEVTRDLVAALQREAAGEELVLFGDARTLEACGTNLAAGLKRDAGAGVTVVALAGRDRMLHAGDVEVATVVSRLRQLPPSALPVAVGAGTINDLVKAAAHELGRRYVAVATAPSMNGYTSAIAAITVGGLKRSLPSTPPVAVLADPGVLASSPTRLAVSGLADLLSKPVSTADWRLEHVLWDSPFCPVPAGLAGSAVEAASAVAAGIRSGATTARTTLFDALIVSGISMAVAGTSSPASGGEHLISHFLDMTADPEPGGPRTPALHGEQVGVATGITTRLYAELLVLDRDDVDWAAARRAAPDRAAVRSTLEDLEWLPSELRRRMLDEATAKLERTGPPAVRVDRIRERWGRLRERLRPDLDAAAALAPSYGVAGCPTRGETIGVPAASLATAYRTARWVRDRYTVLDLADDVGLLDDLGPRVLPV